MNLVHFSKFGTDFFTTLSESSSFVQSLFFGENIIQKNSVRRFFFDFLFFLSLLISVVALLLHSFHVFKEILFLQRSTGLLFFLTHDLVCALHFCVFSSHLAVIWWCGFRHSSDGILAFNLNFSDSSNFDVFVLFSLLLSSFLLFGSSLKHLNSLSYFNLFGSVSTFSSSLHFVACIDLISEATVERIILSKRLTKRNFRRGKVSAV